MPSPIETNGPTGLNALWRGGLLQTLTGADLVSLAAACGVSVRSVQRWVTSAGQQRNPFPQRLTNLPIPDWPEVYAERLRVTLAVALGWESRTVSESPEEHFTERHATLQSCHDWIRDLLTEDLDPWLSLVWRTVSVRRGADVWEVVVFYERAQFDPKGMPPEQPRPEVGGPAPGEQEDSATWLYPASFPTVPGFATEERRRAARMTSAAFPRFSVHVYRWRG